MSKKPLKDTIKSRRQFTVQFKNDAVQMLLDGHTASSIVERLGLTGTNLLYRWKREQLRQSGPVASSLDSRVRDLETELKRVERERDILKKALSIFSRSD
ncbi:transposase [Allorhodopirellula heiligendammensis]|uniref:Transposase n=1 Tax=Allorhodopirellula heiligendammensis TaxID=2714739 RepID=A0A5C6C413_9BACT|nr:transposase [Allorhodopirellula heiligendammensis]TWU18256.1 Transposase [Allorhodopirellula heiligendammensis]